MSPHHRPVLALAFGHRSAPAMVCRDRKLVQALGSGRFRVPAQAPPQHKPASARQRLPLWGAARGLPQPKPAKVRALERRQVPGLVRRRRRPQPASACGSSQAAAQVLRQRRRPPARASEASAVRARALLRARSPTASAFASSPGLVRAYHQHRLVRGWIRHCPVADLLCPSPAPTPRAGLTGSREFQAEPAETGSGHELRIQYQAKRHQPGYQA